MTKGTIVLALFPFTDLTGLKRRPAVIVSSSTKTGMMLSWRLFLQKLINQFNQRVSYLKRSILILNLLA